ncbi:MAG: hypothetical protein ACI4UF_07920 [Thermoguttaceae bacterium]
MLTSPLVRFHHSNFGFVGCCHDAEGVLYFDADDIFTMFGISDRKPFRAYLFSKEVVNSKNKSDFITKDGLNAICKKYESCFTPNAEDARDWIDTEVIPIIKKMKVKPSPTSFTTADEFWTTTFAELFIAFVFCSCMIGLLLRIIP